MAKKAVRLGDMNNAQGRVIQAADKVYINGKKAARKGDPVNQHRHKDKKHPTNPIMQGDSTVIVEGKPLAYYTSQDRCQHKMVQGSDDVTTKGG
jgi:uncharacterized Zn-binding protein involved in type VI secretion